jgi:hypothetical protein
MGSGIFALIFLCQLLVWVSGELSDFDSTDVTSRLNHKFVNKWLDEYFLVSGNRVPPRMFIDWIKLASAHNCSIRPADYRHIFEDLEPFKMPGTSVAYIKAAFDVLKAYKRDVVLLSRDDLTNISERLPYHIGPAMDLVRGVLDPEIDFNLLFHYFDEPLVIPSDDHSLHPYTDMDSVFERNEAFRDEYSQYRDRHSLLRVPTSFVAVPAKFPVMGINRLGAFYDIILPTRRTGLAVLTLEQRDAALKAPEWSHKISKAIFRGSSTGINFKDMKRKGLKLTISPRFLLQEMAQLQQRGLLNCSVQLDFGISKYWQFNGEADDYRVYTEKFPQVPTVSHFEQFKAKYLVVVDGNGWPDRVATFLLSGSLVFMATLHEDWVIRQLQDGVHYMKVKPDLSDLLEKLEWAQQNDELASKIAKNGKEFARQKFNLEQMQVYNALLLMEYQNLFKKWQE